MKTSLLALAVLCAILWPLISSTAQSDSNDASASDMFQSIEHDGIQVTLLEIAQTQTPTGNRISTSLLFMVENKTKTDGKHSHSAPVRFYDKNNNLLFSDASNGAPKTGCRVSRNANRIETCLPAIPAPKAQDETLFVRHWIAAPIPSSVAAVEAEFGLDGKNKKFRFNLQLKNGG